MCPVCGYRKFFTVQAQEPVTLQARARLTGSAISRTWQAFTQTARSIAHKLYHA